MRKPLPVLVGCLALSLGLSACEFSAVPIAARVGGSTITVSDLNAALQSANADPGYLCYIESASSNATAVNGVGSGTYSSSFVANQLGILTSAKALHQAITGANVPTGTTIAMTIAHTQLVDLFTPQSGSTCTESPTQTLAKLDPTYRAALLSFTSDEISLAASYLHVPLTTAGVKAYEAANPKTTSQDCVDAILVATKATADGVYSQLQKGAKFAAVAKANSTDSASAANGGRIGCLNPLELTAPLGPDVENMAVGTFSSPIKFSSGYVILQVATRTFPAPAVAIFDAIETEITSTAYSAAVSRFVNSEHVEVSPQYGTVKIASGTVQITPASGPEAKFLPNATAITPTA